MVAWVIAIVSLLIVFLMMYSDRTEQRSSKEDLERLKETLSSLFEDVRRLRSVCDERKIVDPTYERWRTLPTFDQDFRRAFTVYRSLGEVVKSVPLSDRDLDEYCRVVGKPRDGSREDLLAVVLRAQLCSIEAKDTARTDWLARLDDAFELRLKLRLTSSRRYGYDSRMHWNEDMELERNKVPTWSAEILYLSIKKMDSSNS
jgi:hypothetical protein